MLSGLAYCLAVPFSLRDTVGMARRSGSALRFCVGPENLFGKDLTSVHDLCIFLSFGITKYHRC